MLLKILSAHQATCKGFAGKLAGKTLDTGWSRLHIVDENRPASLPANTDGLGCEVP